MRGVPGRIDAGYFVAERFNDVNDAGRDENGEVGQDIKLARQIGNPERAQTP